MSSSNPYTGELSAAHGILGRVFMHLSAVLKLHTGGQRGRLPSVAALSAACKNRCDRLARGDLKSLLERVAADGDKFQRRLLRILVAMRGLGACGIEARYDGGTLPAFGGVGGCCTRRVRLVRGVGRGVSDQYEGRGGGWGGFVLQVVFIGVQRACFLTSSYRPSLHH
jgi:hypothetical protein